MRWYYVTNADIDGEPYVAAEFIEGWIVDAFRHEAGGSLLTHEQLERRFPEGLTDVELAAEQARRGWLRSLTDEEFQTWLDREWPRLQAVSDSMA